MGLADLGVAVDQERVYRRLLADRTVSRSALAAELALDPAGVDAAVAALAGHGLVRIDDEAPNGMTVLPPSAAVEQLIDRTQDELLERQRRVAMCRGDVPELARIYDGATGDHGREGIERLDSLPRVRDRLEDLAFFTSRYVYSVLPGGPQSAAGLAASRPLDLRALRRGVEMRSIYERSVRDDPDNLAYLREMISLGAQVRFAAGPLERMIVIDDRVAVVPIDPANSAQGALVVHQQGLITAFLQLFEQLWDGATPFPGTVAEADDVTDQERTLLRLLARGVKDDVAAKELGVSARHVRRLFADLATRLDVTSRFGAGAEAARRGWI